METRKIRVRRVNVEKMVEALQKKGFKAVECKAPYRVFEGSCGCDECYSSIDAGPTFTGIETDASGNPAWRDDAQGTSGVTTINKTGNAIVVTNKS